MSQCLRVSRCHSGERTVCQTVTGKDSLGNCALPATPFRPCEYIWITVASLVNHSYPPPLQPSHSKVQSIYSNTLPRVVLRGYLPPWSHKRSTREQVFLQFVSNHRALNYIFLPCFFLQHVYFQVGMVYFHGMCTVAKLALFVNVYLSNCVFWYLTIFRKVCISSILHL